MVEQLITNEILKQVYYSQTIPAIILSSILTALIFFITGMSIVKKSKSNFLLIFFISISIMIIGVLIMYFFPASVQSIIKLFNGGI